MAPNTADALPVRRLDLFMWATTYWPRTPSAKSKNNCVTTEVTVELDKGFDRELGVEYLELTTEGSRARLTIKDKLLQPWGIVHGGVYCSIVEGLASISAHVCLSQNGGGRVVGVNNNTDFLRAI